MNDITDPQANSASTPASNKTELNGLKRREVLLSLLASVGALSTFGCVEHLDRIVTTPHSNQASESSHLAFYSQQEFQLVSRLADLIIPDTDTPGALAVGVPLLMDKLYADWASLNSRTSHRGAIELISSELNQIATQPFLAMQTDSQHDILLKLDTLAFTTDKHRLPSYRSVKKNIARFYYLSEIGATQELRYEAVPGRWEACIAFDSVGRTWAS